MKSIHQEDIELKSFYNGLPFEAEGTDWVGSIIVPVDIDLASSESDPLSGHSTLVPAEGCVGDGVGFTFGAIFPREDSRLDADDLS